MLNLAPKESTPEFRRIQPIMPGELFSWSIWEQIRWVSMLHTSTHNAIATQDEEPTGSWRLLPGCYTIQKDPKILGSVHCSKQWVDFLNTAVGKKVGHGWVSQPNGRYSLEQVVLGQRVSGKL